MRAAAGSCAVVDGSSAAAALKVVQRCLGRSGSEGSAGWKRRGLLCGGRLLKENIPRLQSERWRSTGLCDTEHVGARCLVPQPRPRLDDPLSAEQGRASPGRGVLHSPQPFWPQPQPFPGLVRSFPVGPLVCRLLHAGLSLCVRCRGDVGDPRRDVVPYGVWKTRLSGQSRSPFPDILLCTIKIDKEQRWLVVIGAELFPCGQWLFLYLKHATRLCRELLLACAPGYFRSVMSLRGAGPVLFSPNSLVLIDHALLWFKNLSIKPVLTLLNSQGESITRLETPLRRQRKGSK